MTLATIKRKLQKTLPIRMFNIINKSYSFILSKPIMILKKIIISLFFRNKRTILINDSSISIVLDPKNGYTDKMLFINKERDNELIDFMKSILKKGSTFVDIGANIGYETLWGSFLVGDTGYVYSFEPVPHLAKQIKESIKINNFSNIKLIQKAAGDKEYVTKIYLHKEDAGLTSIENKESATTNIEINVTTLDKELTSITSLSLIKIDVEGYEYEALIGSKNILEKFHPIIIFEFSPYLYEKSYRGKSLSILNFLDSLGYTIKLENETIKKNNFEEFVKKSIEDNIFFNLIAC